MRWFSVRLVITVLFFTNFSSCFAQTGQIVYGFEQAQHLKYRSKGIFLIQSGSFSNTTNANRYQHQLQSLTTYPVTIAHANNLNKVLIGPLHSAEEVRKTANALVRSSGKTILKETAMPQTKRSVRPSHHLVVAEKNAAAFSDTIKPSPAAWANWFVMAGSGAEFPMAHGNMSVNNGSLFPPPYDQDIYTTSQPAGALINLSVGRRWERESKWCPAFSLGLFYQHAFLGNGGGGVVQYSLPEFANYNYQWNLSADVLLASARLNIYTIKRFLPYVMAGVGGSFNSAAYHEMALPEVTPRISPDFSGKGSQFAYHAGAGLDFKASRHVLLNVGYLYQNLGHIASHGKETWSDTSLESGSFELNEVVAGITFLFDK